MGRPSMREIAAAEGSELNRLRARAKGHFYRCAGRVAQIGTGLALALALCGPLALLLLPSLGSALAAMAGAWIFLTRFGLVRLRDEWQLKGVCAQEAWDCDVLGIVSNRSLAPALTPEEIHAAARRFELEEDGDPWYPVRIEAPWPRSTLICQRANAVWAWRQHRSFGWVLVMVMIAIGAAGLIAALAERAGLGTYLLIVLLPSLPGVLDGSDLIERHFWAAGRRQELVGQLDVLITDDGGAAPAEAIRKVQDQLFALRRDGAHVPERFYRHLREDYDRDMHFGAQQALASAEGDDQ